MRNLRHRFCLLPREQAFFEGWNGLFFVLDATDGFTIVINETIKVYTDFIARCIPRGGANNNIAH